MSSPTAIPWPYRVGNLLYRRLFPLYRILYPVYKRLSDREMIALLRREVRPGDTVLDIGGNIGFYTRLLSGLVGSQGRVHSFEPDETNFRHLRRATRDRSNVTLRQAGVGAQTGTIKLYRSPDMNIDHQTYDSGEGRECVEVESLALDDLFATGERVALIKIDIQGFDHAALQGMRRLIARSPGIRILGEYWPHGLQAAGIEPTDYLDLLEEMGFELEFFGKGSATPRELDPSLLSYIDFFGTRR